MAYVAAFRAGLAAVHRSPGRVSRVVAQRAIAACERIHGPDVDRLLALLRRLEAEAALEEARAFAAQVASDETEPEMAIERVTETAEPLYVLRRPPPLIAVNALGDVEFLPAPIEALPVAMPEAA